MTYESKPWLNAYDPGMPAEMVIPETTLNRRLTEIGARYSDKPALHFLGLTMTYGELLGQARRFAGFLQDLGCQKGDVVGINLPNLPQHLVTQVGALLAGCATSGSADGANPIARSANAPPHDLARARRDRFPRRSDTGSSPSQLARLQ